MLGERTRLILEASIRDFIETGHPITSAGLYRKHDFGIKPAMIRWELHDLAGKEFFEQPHPSGGRTPSDKAYRFFVEELLNEIEHDIREEKKARHLAEMLFQGRRKEFISEFAEALGLLGICYDMDSEESHESGLAELMRGIDTNEREHLLGVAEDFEMIPKRMRRRAFRWGDEPREPEVFIGKSPVTESSHLSVIVGRVGGGNLLLVAVGPKRMDYERSIHFIKRLMADSEV